MEVIFACVILAILVLAASQSMYFSKSIAAKQRSRRTALEIANGRLEDVRAAPYSQIASSTTNGTVRYLRRTSTGWSISSSNPGETVQVNNFARPIVTTVQYIDADGGSTSYDCLKVIVRANYAAGANDYVQLETIRAP